MGFVGTIALKAIWARLDQCAPGHTRTKTDHHWCIRFGDRTYPTLPLGPHGRRENPDIETGHVRKMARHLGLMPCAKAVLPQL